MNDKQKRLLIRYGTLRILDKRITRNIGDLCLYQADERAAPERLCKNIIKDDSCLERLWAVNKKNQSNACMAEDAGMGPAKKEDRPPLCPNCQAAQISIDERKDVRRRMAQAKGAITRMAMHLAKTEGNI